MHGVAVFVVWCQAAYRRGYDCLKSAFLAHATPARADFQARLGALTNIAFLKNVTGFLDFYAACCCFCVVPTCGPLDDFEYALSFAHRLDF